MRAKAIATLQKLARLRAADDSGYCRCVSCGKSFHWKDGDGGHFIPKGHSSYWALRIENVNPQCKKCNGFDMKYGTAAQQYTKWMIDKYGREWVDMMEEKKKKVWKLYASDYREMIEKWALEIKQHLERIGE